MVKVGKELAELVGVRIPIAQQGEWEEIAEEEGVASGLGAIDEIEQAHAADNEGSPFKQGERVLHFCPEARNQ